LQIACRFLTARTDRGVIPVTYNRRMYGSRGLSARAGADGVVARRFLATTVYLS